MNVFKEAAMVLVRREFLLVVVKLLFFIVVCFGTTAVAGANTVGKACTADSTCTGDNEYCQFAAWLQPTCRTGLCMCKQGYTTGSDLTTGYSWNLNNPCAQVQILYVGNLCTNSYNELILSLNAICASNGIVTCKGGFVPSGQVCIRAGGVLGEGRVCVDDSECAGEMACYNGMCGCANNFEKYNTTTGECVRREFGDSCYYDTDCRVWGHVWEGFTTSSASCSSRKCTCGSNTQVTISYFDGLTGLVQTKTICVTATATKTAATNYTLCTMDPVANSDMSNVTICSSGYVCAWCPEDTNDRLPNSQGRCRMPIAKKPAVVSYEKPKVPIMAAAGNTNYWYQGWSDQDRMIARVVNGTFFDYKNFRQCSTASQCRLQEQCLMPNQCGRGFCFCVPPNYSDGTNCFLATTSTTTASTSTTTSMATTTTATTSTTTTTGTTSTATTSTRTTATQTTTTSTTSTTTTTTLPPTKYYYSTCASTNECARVGVGYPGALTPNGLVCMWNGTGLQMYCLCSSNNYIWREQYQQCQLREYSDPCGIDSDCDNNLYFKQGSGGGACISKTKTCGCSDGYAPVKAARIMAAWGAVVPSYVTQPEFNRTFCVLASQAVTQISVLGNCTLNILDRTDTSTRTCNIGLLCIGCPLDLLQDPPMGTCVKFVYASGSTSAGGGLPFSGTASGLRSNSAASPIITPVKEPFFMTVIYLFFAILSQLVIIF